MVWGLFPIDPLPGEDEYYIFNKGIYKVGRKGCDIIINKDKGVSRIHAEIIVDDMICMDHLKDKNSKNSSEVRIRDCSKYGTFIKKNMGSREKVHEFPNKEKMLKDGDMVSFGSGNATYRFCFVPLVFFLCSSRLSELNRLLDKTSLIGASVSKTWTLQCTHMVIDDPISINEEIVDAVVAKKSIVQSSWIEFIAGKTICTEIPSSLMHAPSLTLEGVSLKVTNPKSREHCMKGYTFLLESIHKYKFKEKLQLLLEVASAKAVIIETLDPDSSQSLVGETNKHIVCVIPAGLRSNSKCFLKHDSFPKVEEIELISSVFSGHLDPSIIVLAPVVVVTSSCSTDETIVADSDVEMENATSIPTVNLVESAENANEEKISPHNVENDMIIENNTGQGFIHSNHAPINSDAPYDDSVKIAPRKDSVESENIDIIFSQDLIVRDANLPSLAGRSSIDGVVPVNFKLFRKTSAPSGNSFNNLIPFSKLPYEEADYGNEDAAESVKAEKKRKQMEAIADDLFNHENKGRKRGGGAPLRGVFARG